LAEVVIEPPVLAVLFQHDRPREGQGAPIEFLGREDVRDGVDVGVFEFSRRRFLAD
jgi:hypothetical protein